MNSFVATGQVKGVKVSQTKKGKQYITFALHIPVREGFKEVEIRKFCTLWPQSIGEDLRPKYIVEGSHIAIVGTLEGYTVEKDGKDYVNERVVVREITPIAPSIETIGEKHGIEKEELPF